MEEWYVLASNKNSASQRLTYAWIMITGAPVQTAQLQDDPQLATDIQRNNDFVFDQASFPRGHGYPKNSQCHSSQNETTMMGCPFFAHVRKTNPRNDLNSYVIPFPHQFAIHS
jgi:hypothetical protein